MSNGRGIDRKGRERRDIQLVEGKVGVKSERRQTEKEKRRKKEKGDKEKRFDSLIEKEHWRMVKVEVICWRLSRNS